MSDFNAVHATNPYLHLIQGPGPHDAALVRHVFAWTYRMQALEDARAAYAQVTPDTEAEKQEHLDAIRRYAEQMENASEGHAAVLQKHQAEHVKAYEAIKPEFRLDDALRKGQQARARLDEIEAILNAFASKAPPKPVQRIKALSLWQPYATLIMCGAKHYETRHWKTEYRGPLAIHAAKRWTQEERDTIALPVFSAALGGAPLPLGAMLGIVNVVDVIPTEKLLSRISRQERAFGNYSEGRYAWKLEVVEVFAEPVSAKGAQGLFTWEVAS